LGILRGVKGATCFSRALKVVSAVEGKMGKRGRRLVSLSPQSQRGKLTAGGLEKKRTGVKESTKRNFKN